jgi:uncharacterized membrane protein (UPF0182 family)
MPQLRLVVLALQERLGFGPTFEDAMRALFGEAGATRARLGHVPGAGPPAPGVAPAPTPGGEMAPPELRGLIEQAARELAEYQRLTAEGRLGEAGQRLEALKQLLDRLNKGGQER